MRNVTQDVLVFMDYGTVPEQWIINDLGTKQAMINEDFIDELNLQEQIMETELDDSITIGVEAE